MDFKEATEKVLAELKNYRYDRKRISEETGINQKSIYVAQKEGGNEKMYNRLNALLTSVKERANDPAFEVLEIIKDMQAKQEVMYALLIEIYAKVHQVSAIKTKEQFDDMLINKQQKR